MYMRLAVFCLLAMSMVMARENAGDCCSASCRRHVGVYHLNITLTPDLSTILIMTLNADGTMDNMDSLADSEKSVPPIVLGANSHVKGVWKCDGRNRIEATGVIIFYPSPNLPRNLARVVYNLHLNKNDGVSGTVTLTNYDLASTNNRDVSKWQIILGPAVLNLVGYKLFDGCVDNHF